MKLERLAIHGILRFSEPLQLDFSALPSGLVVFVGENGSGKTTCL